MGVVSNCRSPGQCFVTSTSRLANEFYGFQADEKEKRNKIK
jgi:hypothetical protein